MGETQKKINYGGQSSPLNKIMGGGGVGGTIIQVIEEGGHA